MKTVIERFLSKINVVESGCWEWAAYLLRGYGRLKVGSEMRIVHRFIYEYYYGQICPDLTIDHLCRNKRCVNPLHLEQVTNQENARRAKRDRTHCRNGHLITEKNTHFTPNGNRVCRECRKEHWRKNYIHTGWNS